MKEEVNMTSKYKKSIKVVSIADPNLMKRIEDCELSMRTLNCLRNFPLTYLEELASITPHELLRTPNFGRKSLNEVKEILNMYGMMLGTGEKKDYLVINTTNTFEIIPGKTYSRNELEDFMTRKEIEVNIIPRDIRNAERINGVRELA